MARLQNRRQQAEQRARQLHLETILLKRIKNGGMAALKSLKARVIPEGFSEAEFLAGVEAVIATISAALAGKSSA